MAQLGGEGGQALVPGPYQVQDLQVRQLAQFWGNLARQVICVQFGQAPIRVLHPGLDIRLPNFRQNIQDGLVIGGRGGAPGQMQGIGQVAQVRHVGVVQVAHARRPALAAGGKDAEPD